MATLLQTPRPGADADPAAPARTLRVRRHRRGDSAEGWDRYTAPVGPRTTVLDALTWVRAHLDASLNLRHSCLHASCGTCGMRVNGRDVLACVTRLEDLPPGEVSVEPLRNQPLVSDLVVDIESLYESLDGVRLPLVRTSEGAPGSTPAEGVGHLTRFEDCVECGLCVSACPIVASDPEYAGPAVLGAAWRLVDEPRDRDPEPAYALVDGEQGAWRCHLAFECNEVCPTDALPAEEIARLRGILLRHRVVRWLQRHARPEEVQP